MSIKSKKTKQGRWQARLTIGTPPNRFRKKFTADTKAEAEKLAIECLQSIERGTKSEERRAPVRHKGINVPWPTACPSPFPLAHTVVTVEAAILAFIKDKRARVDPVTVQYYCNLLGRFGEWFGDCPLPSVDRQLVNEYIEWRRRGGNCVNNTISKEIKALNTLLRFAYEMKWLGEVVCFKPLREEERARPITIVSDKDFEKILFFIERPELRFCLMLMRYCGLRKSEAMNARHTWFDLERGVLTVRSEGGFKVKTRKPRVIALPDFLVEAYGNLQRTSITFVCPSPTEPGKPICDCRHAWWAACKKAGAPRATLKDLRHSFNTVLADRGVNNKVRAALLGHSTTRMTDNVYTHVTPESLEEAMRQVRKFPG